MFVVTDGVWQSGFVVTNAGVVVVDAPETYGAKIRTEIAARNHKPITTPAYTTCSQRSHGWLAAFADLKGLEIVALTGRMSLRGSRANSAGRGTTGERQ